jgi:prepilin-type N-terminal cleavage/methylation domain-containing protein
MEHLRPNRRFIGYFLRISESAGFTLVELMVVFAIITVVSTVVITSQGTFNKTLILSNTAYDIALAMRSAQTYGLGSRAVGTIVNAGYGLHFQSNPSNSFIFFADISPPPASCSQPNCKSGDRVYTNGSDSLVQTYTLGNGMTITKLCVDSTCSLLTLDIVFERPNPNAHMSADGNYGASYAKACITVTSPHGGEKYVSVAKSGQIDANATSCP